MRNRRMEIGRQRLRAYAEAFEWLENDIRSFCDKRRVRFLTVPTDVPMTKILYEGMIRSEMFQ